MSDFNDFTFMRWKNNIGNFLWENYKTILAGHDRREIEKGLNELKGVVAVEGLMYESDRQYLINEFNEALAKFDKKGGQTMIHRYIATFVYTARVPIEAEDEYEAEDLADEIPEERYIDNLTFDHIDIEQE